MVPIPLFTGLFNVMESDRNCPNPLGHILVTLKHKVIAHIHVTHRHKHTHIIHTIKHKHTHTHTDTHTHKQTLNMQ